MAKITFKGQSDFFQKLKKLEDKFEQPEILKKAVRAGAAPVADQIKKNLEALPEDDYRHLQAGDSFRGIPKGQKEDLINSFGLTPISQDRNGFIHTKAGFDGYGSFPTAAYPEGLPNQMVARAVESGSSVRQKTPFVRPAVKATEKEAVEAMETVIDEEIEEIFKEV